MSETVKNSFDVASKQWNVALQKRDCRWLMELLQQHPRLWLQASPEDRTVLHVAVLQGCVELVKQVLEPHDDKGDRIEFQMNVNKLLHAKDGKCRADVFNLAYIIGNREVSRALKLARKVESENSRDSKGGSSKSSSHGRVDASEYRTSDILYRIDIDNDNYQDVRGAEDDINQLIAELPKSDLLRKLQRQMTEDVDYNFEKNQKGLIFHLACKRGAYTNRDFITTVAEKAKERPGLLTKLFNLRDPQGRAPLHVATDYCKGDEIQGLQVLLDLMPDECVNTFDGGGRTALLRATANGMSLKSSQVVRVLTYDRRTNLNAEWLRSGATALHVAALHGHAQSAKFLLTALRDKAEQRVDVEKQMRRPIKVHTFHQYLNAKWTPLELAVVMGRFSVVLELLKHCRAIRDQRCLHYAAAAGDPRVIQALLINRSEDLQHFESNEYFGGYSCLHFAVNATLPHQPFRDIHLQVQALDETFDRFLAFEDFASVYWLEQELTAAKVKGPRKFGLLSIGYGSKKICSQLLLQAGVEIWPSRDNQKLALGSSSRKKLDSGEESSKDDDRTNDQDLYTSVTLNYANAIPDPGSDASDDDRLWWYALVAKETQEAKNNFNAAGNATAVVAALVATASFIGPLQPPLGYESTLDTVQTSRLPVRIFMASNGLSFYLAVASIMLAIMPSLPLSQDGLREELHRNRRTVALAIMVLLLSILGILVSFTATLIAVVPEDYEFGLKFYPAFSGAMVCVVVLFVFFLRLLRLIFNRSARIKTVYRLFGKL